MKLIITAKLCGGAEAYKIYIDGEAVVKVRGDKTTTLEVTNEKHTIQLKSGNGKSSIINISPENGEKELKLNFVTHYFRVFREGYFELVGKE